MAEISKKPLLDADSNKFLESKGFINLTNSFEGSSWRYKELNMIFNLKRDLIINSDKDIYNLFYNTGYVKAQKDILSDKIASKLNLT